MKAVCVLLLAVVAGTQGLLNFHGNNRQQVRPMKISDLMPYVLAMKGHAGMSDPVVKGLTMMSMFGGEGATVTPQQIMQLSGQQTPLSAFQHSTTQFGQAVPHAEPSGAASGGEGGAMNQMLDMMLMKSMLSGMAA